MNRLRRVLAIAAIAAMAFTLAACSRKITRVDVVQQPMSCFTCHADTTTALVSAELQWEHSKHASGRTLNENFGDCRNCHTSQGFVARVTGTTAPDPVPNPGVIHCFTCHAPHTNGDLRLRWTQIATLMNGMTFDLHAANTCTACHHARQNVTTYVSGRVTLSTRWGPHHGVQTDMLLGSNGYQYAGFTYEQSPHKNITTIGGMDGCLECHFKTTDRLTVGGHTFTMEGVDAVGDTVQNLAACAPCHGPVTSFDVNRIQTQVDSLAALLEGQLLGAGLIAPSEGEILPVAQKTSADSAGAVWNWLMATEDRSHGVHNAKYIVGLLQSSIQFLQGASFAPAHATTWRGRAR